MNIIGGVVRPDGGDDAPRRVAVCAARTRPMPARRRIAFIHQELNLFTNLTIAENIFSTGFPRRRVGPLSLIDRRQPACPHARTLLAQVSLDLAPDTPLDRLSPGERQLVEVAKALQLDARDHHLRRADDLADRARDGAPLRADRAAARKPARR